MRDLSPQELSSLGIYRRAVPEGDAPMYLFSVKFEPHHDLSFLLGPLCERVKTADNGCVDNSFEEFCEIKMWPLGWGSPDTVKPVLSGHPRDLPKCPLNRGSVNISQCLLKINFQQFLYKVPGC